MHRRSPAALIPWVSILVLVACGPEKDAGESDTGSTDATTGDATTGDLPTGTTTDAATDATGTATGTGTTGDGAQPVLCAGEPASTAVCVEVCVRDVDPETAVVEPNCRVIETQADMTSAELPKCVAVMDAWQPPAGAEACFAVLIDRDGKETPSTLDDMSLECTDAGHNAQIVLIRSAPGMAGACATVTCEVSTNIMRDCPNL